MPIPAILAVLARAGAAIAARAGAGGAARSLVGMARAAGPAAARRAAARVGARAAASRGTAAAATHAAESAAAEGIHIQPGNAHPPGLGIPRGGAHVLEDTRLTNARSMFQAIYGQTPPAGATAGTAAAPASQVQAAASAAQQSAASQTAAQAAAPQSAGAPPASPPPPQAPPGSTPPSNPRSQGFLDRISDAFHRAKAVYQSAQQRFTPIAEQVANLSVDQRYGRLQQLGKLSNIGDVAKQFGTPNPSREQHVQHSEAEEERQRQEEISKSRSASVGQAVWGAGKRSLVGALATATPAGIATAPIWMYGVIKGFETLGRTISETNRDLRKFDENISDSFARLDYAQLRSRQKIAGATSGSASFLNETLISLIRELQPVRQTLTTGLNTLAILAVNSARLVNILLQLHPAVKASVLAAEALEKRLREQKTQEAQAAAKDFLRAQRDGTFSMPKARRPGGG